MFFDPFPSLFPSFPEVDLAESDSHFYVAASLPQVKKGSVEVVSQEDRTICISGARSITPFYLNEPKAKDDKKDQSEELNVFRVLSQERYSGTFRRCLRFSSSIKPNEIIAKMQEEELFLTIPKAKPVHEKVFIARNSSE